MINLNEKKMIGVGEACTLELMGPDSRFDRFNTYDEWEREIK